MLASLSTTALSRYQRHMALPQIGLQGQQKLAQSSVLCVGAGGLACSALAYLAAAGVGKLAVIDDDVVELSNLQRQILYSVEDLARPKVAVARERLLALNPELHIDSYQQRLTLDNALATVANYQLVIDASDNYYTRYLVNDACVQLNKPNVYASINQFAGQCTVFYPNQKGPCYRCLFPQPESAELANCAEAGVLGVLPGLLGTLQATEAIKWLLDIGQTLISRLLTVDALTMEWREFQLTSDPQCPLCVAKMGFAQLPRGPLPACPSRIQEPVPQISVTQLKQQLAKGPVNLLDVRQEEEHGLANMGGQVIPLNTLADRWSTLDPSRPLVVYCQSGQRSQAAVRLLIEQGFTEVSSLAGGLTAWFAEPGQAKVS